MTTPDPLVFPLEDAYRPVIEAVLRKLGSPGLADVARLGPRLAALSQAYNHGRAGDAPGRAELPLEARVAFSFARDVPKGGAAVAELVAAGLVEPARDGALRVLDLGAGLGAMSVGIARALSTARVRAGVPPIAVEALLVDADERALAAGKALVDGVREGGAGAAFGLEGVRLGVRTHVGRFEGSRLPPLPERGPFDLVIFGQVLSELDTTVEPTARVRRHADLVRAALELVGPRGAVVVVEPALRDRSRHLHAVRDVLLDGEPKPVVFAPCLHAAPCPTLRTEGDWCHEDRAVDLPEWLVPLARAAGLRFQGLTFSYLVLRKELPALRDRVGVSDVPGRLHLRVVSDLMPSKGKVEVFGCTHQGERVRLRRLDRERTDANAPFDELARGDVVTLSAEGSASPETRGRLDRSAAVDVHPTRS